MKLGYLFNRFGSLYILLFACGMVICTNGFAQTTRIYGDLNSYALSQRCNSGYLNFDENTDLYSMIAQLQGNLYLSISESALGTFFMQTSISGDVAPEEYAFKTGNTIPPNMAIQVPQFYFRAPLLKDIDLTMGKKPVVYGYSNFFNVSNRMVPRMFSALPQEDANPAIVSLECYSLSFLSIGAFFYLSDFASWNKSSEALFVQLQFDPVNIDLIAYLEQQSNPGVGYNVSWQIDRVKLYVEGMVARISRQATLLAVTSGDPVYDFKVSSGAIPSFQQVFGLALNAGTMNLTVEYLYRNDGLSNTERQRQANYIKTLATDVVRSEALQIAYHQYSWDTHYLAMNINASFIDDLVMTQATLILSGSKDLVDWSTHGSVLGQLQMSFVPHSSLQLSAFVQHIWGGEYSEFMNYQSVALVGGIVVTYSFSSNSF